jgi:hypothetical protein
MGFSVYNRVLRFDCLGKGCFGGLFLLWASTTLQMRTGIVRFPGAVFFPFRLHGGFDARCGWVIWKMIGNHNLASVA